MKKLFSPLSPFSPFSPISVIDILLLSIAVLSFGGMVYIMSRKIPFLLAVPQNIINESFLVRPSKAKIFYECLKSYIIEQKFEIPILGFFEWFFWRIRIIFLKLERISFGLLSFIRARKNRLKIPKAQRDYMEEMNGGDILEARSGSADAKGNARVYKKRLPK